MSVANFNQRVTWFEGTRVGDIYGFVVQLNAGAVGVDIAWVEEKVTGSLSLL